MSTILVFLMIVSELAAIAAGYFVPMPELFNAAMTYASPLFLIKNSLGENPMEFGNNILIPLVIAFHAIKYLLLCRSQFTETHYSLHYAALFLEIGYLVMCARYI